MRMLYAFSERERMVIDVGDVIYELSRRMCQTMWRISQGVRESTAPEVLERTLGVILYGLSPFEYER